jgi:hypothetical protein
MHSKKLLSEEFIMYKLFEKENCQLIDKNSLKWREGIVCLTLSWLLFVGEEIK